MPPRIDPTAKRAVALMKTIGSNQPMTITEILAPILGVSRPAPVRATPKPLERLRVDPPQEAFDPEGTLALLREWGRDKRG